MHIIGIDVGGMSIKFGLCNEHGEILYSTRVKTGVYSNNKSISNDIYKGIIDLLSISKVSMQDIYGIGIGHPGVVDSVNGVIKYANNIPMENVKIVKELKELLDTSDISIYINNDANCAALGEMMFGSAKGYKDVVFVTLGTGVGSGIVINGELFEGRESGGAEAGHTVIISDGIQCNCGRRGCYEVYASATALMNQTRAAMTIDPDSSMHGLALNNGGEVNGKTAFDAAKAGDKTAMGVVKQYIRYISEGLLNLANIFRPEVIIIGGGISYEGAFLTDPLNDDMSKLTFGGKHNPAVLVKTAELKNDAGILGAVALVLNKNKR